jgi:radical SAM protein (TIGR01212 family)
MALSELVNTLGQDLLRRYGERVHKVAVNAGMTCPNRDGSKGQGGCTFCNNVSFSPNARQEPQVIAQLAAGRRVVAKRTGAHKLLAYFQAYTNTYADVAHLAGLYEQALREPDVIGLSIGTRPDCVPPEVLDLLAGYQDRGSEVWLELGLQSAFDETLERINRGHGFAEYRDAVRAARARGLKVCTHLIVGLPGEGRVHPRMSLERVLDLGVDGLKLHPLHVVKGTALANAWRWGEYQPLRFEEYLATAADLIERTPREVIYHRVTGTAARAILLAPEWCSQKWAVLNGIEAELRRRGSSQGALEGLPWNADAPAPRTGARERKMSGGSPLRFGTITVQSKII